MTTSTSPNISARPTPLYGIHQELGAQFTEFAGWTMPVCYHSDIAEHHAVRRTAGLFDLSHMAEIEVSGPGAAAALDFAVVGKPSDMSSGQARYSMICDENGGILDDLVVYRLGYQRYLVVANAANTWTVYAALTERAGGYDATVTHVTDDWVLIAVQGPRAQAILDTRPRTSTSGRSGTTRSSPVRCSAPTCCSPAPAIPARTASRFTVGPRRPGWSGPRRRAARADPGLPRLP